MLCDAGPLLALVDRQQPQHQACRKAVSQVDMPLITTWPCLAEAMYLALRRGRWLMQSKIRNLILQNLLQLYEIQEPSYSRLFVLMERYQDRPMDLADATLVVAAESLGIKRILTLDSDFLFYRIHDSQSFELVNLTSNI